MTGRLNVTFVDHSSELGGAELALTRLLQSDQDWHAALVVPKAAEGQADAFGLSAAYADVIRVGPRHEARKSSRGGPVADAILALRIVGSALRLVLTQTVRRSDVLVANTTRASVFVALASMALRKPFVVHIRDLIEPEGVGGAATALMRRLVLPRASAVIANSHASLAVVAPHVKSTCIQKVVPSPAGLSVVSADDLSVPLHVARIGMVARLDPWKGQELLIEAFADAFPDGDEKLILFGGPSFGHNDFPLRLAALATHREVGARVELVGHVTDANAAISSLDICVQCSVRAEPLGQNVLQYLAGGKPTIVSNEGGPSEWVKNGVNGLTFSPRDRASLAEQLRRLGGSHALRSRLARRAIATPRLLSDNEVGAEIYEVVRRVAENRR